VGEPSPSSEPAEPEGPGNTGGLLFGGAPLVEPELELEGAGFGVEVVGVGRGLGAGVFVVPLEPVFDAVLEPVLEPVTKVVLRRRTARLRRRGSGGLQAAADQTTPATRIAPSSGSGVGAAGIQRSSRSPDLHRADHGRGVAHR
jgi:hypothetical protein